MRQREASFSDTTWGKATRGYTTLARSLTNTELNAIIQDAQEFIRLVRARNTMADVAETIDDLNGEDVDPRACLVINSYTDEEWKLFFSSLAFPNVVF